MKKTFRWIWRLAWKSALWFFGITIGMVVIYRFVPIPFTPLMVIRCVEQGLDPGKDLRLYKDWVPISEISKNVSQAVVAAEDQKFLEHHGFDLEAMEKAWEHNKKGGESKEPALSPSRRSKTCSCGLPEAT